MKARRTKEGYNIISRILDMETMRDEIDKMREKGGEDWTDEKKVKYLPLALQFRVYYFGLELGLPLPRNQVQR